MHDKYDDGFGATKRRSKAPIVVGQYYGLTLDFGTVAAASNGSASAKVDGNWSFVGETIQITIWTPALQSPSIAGTPYPPIADASPPASVGNTFPTLAHFRLQLVINDTALFRQPVRCSLLAGTGDKPHYLLTKLRVRKGETVTATLYNDVTATFGAQAQVLIEGYYEKPAH